MAESPRPTGERVRERGRQAYFTLSLTLPLKGGEDYDLGCRLETSS